MPDKVEKTVRIKERRKTLPGRGAGEPVTQYRVIEVKESEVPANAEITNDPVTDWRNE